MKSLAPSQKENKRYLLVKGGHLQKDIEKAILDFIGTLGLSRAGLGFIETRGNYAIISVNREALNEVRASFAVFPEKISVERVSGTLNGLEKEPRKPFK